MLVIFISVLGIGGCVWLLYLTRIQLNVGSYTGIIMIVGIIAENAIFTVNQFMTTYHTTGDVDRSINYAISLRIRPKLMTAIGAILALMPLALGYRDRRPDAATICHRSDRRLPDRHAIAPFCISVAAAAGHIIKKIDTYLNFTES